jgi:hypothetical protein
MKTTTRILGTVSLTLLLMGCSKTPEAKKLNNDFQQKAENAEQKLGDAAKAVGDATVSGSKALAEEARKAANELSKEVESATEKPADQTPANPNR